MKTSQLTATEYDFAHPRHKLQSELPVLELVNQRVSQAIAAALTDKLQISMRGSAEQTRHDKYMDCLESLGPNCVIHELSLAPLPGPVWFCMNTNVLAAVVDAYFGGNAEIREEAESRELSRTEQRVMVHIVQAVLKGIQDGWSMIVSLDTSLIRQIDIKRLANSAMEQVMLTTAMTLNINDVELHYSLVYQFETLKPIANSLKTEKQSNKAQDKEFSLAMQRELLNCELDIRGVLSETNITLGRLLELKTGDFIPLRDVQTVSFKTQNMPLFDARVGQINGRVSASLSRWHLSSGTSHV